MFKYLLLIAIITVSACSSSEKDFQITPEPKLSLSQQAESLKTSASCKAKGGSWEKIGKPQREGCILPTSDAGKNCTDSKQCQVACITSKENIQPGTQVTGQCHDSTYQFGCRTYVADGKAEATLCID